MRRFSLLVLSFVVLGSGAQAQQRGGRVKPPSKPTPHWSDGRVPRTWRVVYMDGRPHPKGDDVNPSYFGHSVGHWEGETLVIDTVGFNERFWFTRRPTGMVHTEQLHLIERITRPNFDTLHY